MKPLIILISVIVVILFDMYVGTVALGFIRETSDMSVIMGIAMLLILVILNFLAFKKLFNYASK